MELFSRWARARSRHRPAIWPIHRSVTSESYRREEDNGSHDNGNGNWKGIPPNGNWNEKDEYDSHDTIR